MAFIFDHASNVWPLYLLKLEKVQRNFTERIPLLHNLPYSERLAFLKLESLERYASQIWPNTILQNYPQLYSMACWGISQFYMNKPIPKSTNHRLSGINNWKSHRHNVRCVDRRYWSLSSIYRHWSANTTFRCTWNCRFQMRWSHSTLTFRIWSWSFGVDVCDLPPTRPLTRSLRSCGQTSAMLRYRYCLANKQCSRRTRHAYM